jgi:hypothetical protein
MELIIEKLAKDANTHEVVVRSVVEEVSNALVKEGCGKDEPRFMQYLIRRVKIKLKIEDSKTYTTFKQFFRK